MTKHLGIDQYASLERRTFTAENYLITVITTCDGSPTVTLDLLDKIPVPKVDELSFDGSGANTNFADSTNEKPERMHHPAGALTETDYVYGSTTRRVMSLGLPPHFVIMGLGLAYIEMCVFANILKEKGAVGCREARVVSFESIPLLVHSYFDWLLHPNLEIPFHGVYEEVLIQVAKFYSLGVEELRAVLAQAYTEKRWICMGAAEDELKSGFRFSSSAIMYDAYSSKTDSLLWSEEFLKTLIDQLAAPRHIFATYASTGTLKRALKATGFTIQIIPGFAGKRESILADRGLT